MTFATAAARRFSTARLTSTGTASHGSRFPCAGGTGLLTPGSSNLLQKAPGCLQGTDKRQVSLALGEPGDGKRFDRDRLRPENGFMGKVRDERPGHCPGHDATACQEYR